MTKLYELLALAVGKNEQASSVFNRVSDLFRDQRNFLGLLRTHVPKEEKGDETVKPIQMQPEYTQMQYRVDDLVDEYRQKFDGWLKVEIRKDITNTQAFAELAVDDQNFGELPATALLTLVSKLKELRKLIEKMPTLPLADPWEYDENSETYTFKRVKNRTEKRERVVTVVPVTEFHPAQTHVYNEDVLTGFWDERYESSLWPQHRKREQLERIDKLIEAATVARKRANDVDAVEEEVTANVLKYIWGD